MGEPNFDLNGKNFFSSRQILKNLSIVKIYMFFNLKYSFISKCYFESEKSV